MSAAYQSKDVFASQSMGEMQDSRGVNWRLGWKGPATSRASNVSCAAPRRALETEVVKARLAQYDMTADETEICAVI